MALTAGDKATWANIKSIYTNLNTVRTQHSLSTYTVPENQNAKINLSHIKTLSDRVKTTHDNHDHLRSVAQTRVTLPAVGDKIRAGFIDTISRNVARMKGICHNSFSFGDCNRCDGFCDSGGFN